MNKTKFAKNRNGIFRTVSAKEKQIDESSNRNRQRCLSEILENEIDVRYRTHSNIYIYFTSFIGFMRVNTAIVQLIELYDFFHR